MYNNKDKNLKILLVKVRELKDGRMDDHPGVRHHIDRALATGDAGPFFRFLEKNPKIEKMAKRNRRLAQYQKEINPFRPYPDTQTVRERLSGPLKLGYVNEFDDMLGIAYDVLGGYHEVVLWLSLLPVVFGLAVFFTRPPTRAAA